MNNYPKIKSVKALKDKKLEISFDCNIKKIYDCNKLIQKESFKILENDLFFKNVHTDSGGYGIIWNDDVDLSESELWLNGKEIQTT